MPGVGLARMQMHDGRARLGGFDRRLGDLVRVTGRWGDIDGVWTEPVMAQVMMTLFRDGFMGLAPRGFWGPGCLLRVQAILSYPRWAVT